MSFKYIPERATPVEAAGLLVDSDGAEYLSGIANLLCEEFGTSEYKTAMQYTHDYDGLQEYLNIRFMLACFTLLEAGDDNF